MPQCLQTELTNHVSRLSCLSSQSHHCMSVTDWVIWSCLKPYRTGWNIMCKQLQLSLHFPAVDFFLAAPCVTTAITMQCTVHQMKQKSCHCNIRRMNESATELSLWYELYEWISYWVVIVIWAVWMNRLLSCHCDMSRMNESASGLSLWYEPYEWIS